MFKKRQKLFRVSYFFACFSSLLFAMTRLSLTRRLNGKNVSQNILQLPRPSQTVLSLLNLNSHSSRCTCVGAPSKHSSSELKLNMSKTNKSINISPLVWLTLNCGLIKRDDATSSLPFEDSRHISLRVQFKEWFILMVSNIQKIKRRSIY